MALAGRRHGACRRAARRLALHDLTGFEGRCDAILFARDPHFTPPNAIPKWRPSAATCLGLPQQPEQAGAFDLVVTGGGIAGTAPRWRRPGWA